MQHIYLITNTRTGKVYVGMTKDTKKRFAVHRSELKLGNHSNPALQADYNDGQELHYQVLETISSRDDAKVVEREWINAFPDSYNLVNRHDAFEFRLKLGDHCRGVPRPASVMRKLSDNQRKPCTVDGVTVYPSVRAMAQQLGSGSAGRRHPNFKFV